MRAGAMVLGRMKRLVYGASDPKAGVTEPVFNITHGKKLNSRIAATTGVLEKDCAGLVKEFFKKKRNTNN